MKRFSTALLVIAIVLTIILSLTVLFACDPDDGGSGWRPPSDEYSIDREDGTRQLTLYWNKSGEIDFSTSDMWIWWDGKDGSGYIMHPCDYGAKVVVNVPDTVAEVGFIVRTSCSDPGGSSWGTATKDFENDRYAVLTGDYTYVFLRSGDGEQYTSSDGGKTLDKIKTLNVADIVNLNTIKYTLNPKVRITSLDMISLRSGDKEIAIKSLSSLNNEVIWGNITTAEDLDLTASYTLSIEGYGETPVVPMTVFGSQDFGEKYNYDGWLGNTISGDSVEFRVWAPTASKVVLNIYDNGNGGQASRTADMTLGEKGVWSATLDGCVGKYYTYSVTTSVGTQEAVDPYAKSTGVNGDRGMIIDLDSTDPDGWDTVTYADNISRYTDAVIWEVHVRDFSNKITASQYKGKYLAFTETGLKNSHGISVGVDYLKELGITHVHLMPSYDYATVDESSSTASFNWGYDPKNYNTPEGSYSTDPYHGEVRVNEFKRMVESLHNQGLGVVMDVVYNHTYDANSSFNRIVPYYYYRYTSSGANSSASGCGNDTASERYMFRKFIVDSVSYWTEEYKVDGFRFDLMGLHDLETMDAVEKAVHAINPSAIIYGEGWTMGSTSDGSAQANQTNVKKIVPESSSAGGVAVFSDAIRDGLKGSVFSSLDQGYINGAARTNYNKVKFAIDGSKSSGIGWTVNNACVINYMSCHDNLTLWDKLAISNATSSVEDRLAMNRLGATIVMLSQGTPFMQAGEEMLRSKGGDENSYKSSDSVNNLDWEKLSADSQEYQMFLFYKGLIALRKSSELFTSDSSDIIHTFDVNSATGAMTISYSSADIAEKAVVVLNPASSPMTVTLPSGNWKMLSDGTTSGTESLKECSGTITVPAIGTAVFISE